MLQRDTTLRNLYEDFQSQNPGYCAYSTCHTVFKKEYIGFGEPNEDICDVCAVYKNLQEDEITESVSTSRGNHIAKMQEARKAYNEDK